MKNLFSGFILCLLLSCTRESETVLPEKRFIIKTSPESISTIESEMYASSTFGPGFSFRDKTYSITNCNMGEWGASIFFRDSTSRRKTCWESGTIFSFGKTDSTYLFYSRNGRQTHSLITLFKRPDKLPRLPDTMRFCWEWKKIPGLMDEMNETLKNSDILQQIGDFEDSISTIGIFTKGQDIYAIRSDAFGYHHNITFLARLNPDFETFTTLDTLLNIPVITAADKVGLLYQNKQYIGFSDRRKKGYFILTGDTICIAYEK